MATIDLGFIRKFLLRDALQSAGSSDRSANSDKSLRIVILATKSHSRIIEESGKIGHGIYASIR